jgi:hypothetical protein
MARIEKPIFSRAVSAVSLANAQRAWLQRTLGLAK